MKLDAPATVVSIHVQRQEEQTPDSVSSSNKQIRLETNILSRLDAKKTSSASTTALIATISTCALRSMTIPFPVITICNVRVACAHSLSTRSIFATGAFLI